MIENTAQLENTRIKIREMEDQYAKTAKGSAESEYVRTLTMRSLRKRINQFKEEVARYEAHAGTSSVNAGTRTPAC
jgi:hypothetical protein